MTSPQVLHRLALTAIVVVTTACRDGGSDAPTGNNGPASRAYTLTVTPGALTIVAGERRTATITIDRANFTGGVTLELVSPPSGITGAFTPSSPTTNTSDMSLTVAASVPPGHYPLTIKGVATNLADRSAALPLTVIAAPTVGRNVEYIYCDAANAPVFFAYQDGTGVWQPVTRSLSGGAIRFAFNVGSSRGGVLAVFRSSSDVGALAAIARAKRSSPGIVLGNRYDAKSAESSSRTVSAADIYITEVLYATTAELAQDGAETCAETLPTKTIRATIAGVSPGQYAFASLGSSTKIFDGAMSTNPITISGVRGGFVDFVGSRIVRPGSPPDKAVVVRNLNVPDGGSLPSTIDFSGTASVVPTSAMATITGSMGQFLEIYTEINTSTSNILLCSDLERSVATVRPWTGLAATQMATGDFHSLIVFAGPQNPTGDFRVAGKYVAQVTDQTLGLGPIVDPPIASRVAGGTFPRYRFRGSLTGDYNKGVGIEVAGDDPGNVFSIVATSAYLAASGNALTYDLTMPDVVGLTGLPPAARLDPGTNSVGLDAFGFTGAGVAGVQPAVGSEFKASVRVSTINVP